MKHILKRKNKTIAVAALALVLSLSFNTVFTIADEVQNNGVVQENDVVDESNTAQENDVIQENPEQAATENDVTDITEENPATETPSNVPDEVLPENPPNVEDTTDAQEPIENESLLNSVQMPVRSLLDPFSLYDDWWKDEDILEEDEWENLHDWVPANIWNDLASWFSISNFFTDEELARLRAVLTDEEWRILCNWLGIPYEPQEDYIIDLVGGDGTIVIDGYYSDWDDIPKTIITGREHPEKKQHKGAIIRDDEYIYVYLETGTHYADQIPLNRFTFKIADEEVDVFIHYVNSKKDGPNWRRSSDELSSGIHLGLAPFTGPHSAPRGAAAVTIRHKKNEADRLEFAISIKELAKLTGIDNETILNGAEISFKAEQLGRQKLVIVGTSTGPLVGVTICIMMVAAIFGVRRYREKRSLE